MCTIWVRIFIDVEFLNTLLSYTTQLCLHSVRYDTTAAGFGCLFVFMFLLCIRYQANILLAINCNLKYIFVCKKIVLIFQSRSVIMLYPSSSHCITIYSKKYIRTRLIPVVVPCYLCFTYLSLWICFTLCIPLLWRNILSIIFISTIHTIYTNLQGMQFTCADSSYDGTNVVLGTRNGQ